MDKGTILLARQLRHPAVGGEYISIISTGEITTGSRELGHFVPCLITGGLFGHQTALPDNGLSSSLLTSENEF